LGQGNDFIIPEEHDCINPMNSQIVYPNNETEEYAYGYDDSRTIRGGKGVNISYRFVTTDLIESDNAPSVDEEGNKLLAYNMELSASKRVDATIKLKCPENGQTVYIYNNDNTSRIRNYSDPFYVSNFLGY
jgi:hypothetical protein